MFNKHDLAKNTCMLRGSLAREGYDWWWHNFTGYSEKTGEERSFFIEYFLINPALGGAKPILGQSRDAKNFHWRPSYAMVKAGAWGKGAVQLHRFFSPRDVIVDIGVPYSFSAEDCFATEDLIKGSVSVDEKTAEKPEYMCGAGEMSWELRVDKKIAFNVGKGTSLALRTANAFEMYWHAEGIKTEYSGEVIFNGEKYIVSPKTCFGYADKNWGSDFTSPWLWLSSNNLFSNLTGKRLENSVFAIGGGRPKIYGKALDGKLLSAFYYEGREFEFNFSKPGLVTQTKFDCEQTDSEVIWHVSQTSVAGKIDCRIKCPKNEMLLVNYEAPNGKKLHNNLWNGGTGRGRIKLYARNSEGKLYLLDDISVKNCGCEYGEYDK